MSWDAIFAFNNAFLEAPPHSYLVDHGIFTTDAFHTLHAVNANHRCGAHGRRWAFFRPEQGGVQILLPWWWSKPEREFTFSEVRSEKILYSTNFHGWNRHNLGIHLASIFLKKQIEPITSHQKKPRCNKSWGTWMVEHPGERRWGVRSLKDLQISTGFDGNGTQTMEIEVWRRLPVRGKCGQWARAPKAAGMWTWFVRISQNYVAVTRYLECMCIHLWLSMDIIVYIHTGI